MLQRTRSALVRTRMAMLLATRSFTTAGRLVAAQSVVARKQDAMFPSSLVRPAPLPNAYKRFYASNSYPPHIKINMPALSPTMTSGNIGAWNKKVGDAVNPGDVLCAIETDKATMDFECQEEGYLAKILVPEGAKDVPINTLLAILASEQKDVPAFAEYTASAAPSTTPAPKKPTPEPAAAAPAAPKPSPAPAAAPAAPKAQPATPSPPAGDRIFASPLAKKLAAEKKIPLESITGTGPNGRITKEDVLNYKPSAAAPKPAAAAVQPLATAEYTDIPLSNMRQVIASRLLQSKQSVPHYYLTVDINMDKVLSLRQQFNSKADPKSPNPVKLSVNDFIIKASAKALQRVPEVNSSWMGDFIRRYHNADISVAVATENGLITPIVTAAETRGLTSISSTVKELSEKAKAGKLAPHEFQGGSFTISNLGMYGVNSFSAIINMPQSCILAVGAVEPRVVPAADKNGVQVSQYMSVTLSCDHRVVDGAVGAQWLQAFRGYLEDPTTMLL